MKKLTLCAILMCFWQAAPAIAEGSRDDAGLQIYSDMGFVREEGEYSGLQIAIVPYNPNFGARTSAGTTMAQLNSRMHSLTSHLLTPHRANVDNRRNG